MRSVLSTDKNILLNDQPLSKYGDATNNVWNITMPNGGWKGSGKPVRIWLANTGTDFIHQDDIYEATGSNYVSIQVDISRIYKDSKCSEDWFTFDYDFRIIPQNLVSPVGDYNIGYSPTCLYNDQDIYLVVKYGTASNPYMYSEIVDTFNSTSWGPSVRRVTGGFVTSKKIDYLERISWWVVTENDEAPIRLTYNYSDRYGQGFSGTKSQSWYSFYDIDSGRELCSATSFGYTSASGMVGSTAQSISVSNSKRIY